MIIAVNTIVLLKINKEGHSNFIYECFIRITKQYPQHTFIFISDKPFDSSFNFSSNIIPVVLGLRPGNLLLLKLWYNYRIPAVLKKYKADVFICTDVLCSMRTKVRQLLIIHDLIWVHHPELISKRYLKFYKSHASKFLNKAAMITALSNLCKDDIIANYEISARKIDAVHIGINGIFKPIDFAEKEKIKEQYSGSNEYFLFYNSVHADKNLLNILKAFSIFKKWQKSNMQLLIFSNNTLNAQLLKALRLFKYRDEVKVLEHLPYQLPKVIAAAYAMVDFTYYENFGAHSLRAMKCNVPVIMANESVMTEIFGNVALYVNPNEQKDIAEKMMTIFKDERLRRELIEKGEEQARKYSWEQTSELFWESILKASH